MTLDDKAKHIQSEHDKYGLYEGMAYGHRKNLDGTRKAVVSISDACFHTGQALASEALRLQVTGNIEASNKIVDMVTALNFIQDSLGDGQLARFHVLEHDPGIPEKYRQGSVYYWQEMTWDQYIPIFYGMYHVYQVRKMLPMMLTTMIKKFLQKMGNHFIKHGGFKGPDYNLKVHPWYLPFKKPQILYGNCIMYVCWLWTQDSKFHNQMFRWERKYWSDLVKMGAKSKPMAERWYVRAWMKTAYFFRNRKFVPKDVLISQDHLESRIGPHLRFMALVPLVRRGKIYKDILEIEYNDIQSRNHPWFMANYAHATNDDSDIDKDFFDQMKAYRGPQMYTVPTRLTLTKYLTYLGNVIERHSTPLSSRFYLQHWAWPQSQVFNPGSWFGEDSNYYDDHVGWLLPYYLMKLNKWDK